MPTVVLNIIGANIRNPSNQEIHFHRQKGSPKQLTPSSPHAAGEADFGGTTQVCFLLATRASLREAHAFGCCMAQEWDAQF